MDYKELLRKYIRHVGREEGSTFMPYPDIDGFTEEERKELIELDDYEFPDVSNGRSPEYVKELKKLLLEDLESKKYTKVINGGI